MKGTKGLVALALASALIGGCDAGGENTAGPGKVSNDGELRPGAELHGMRLITAAETDTQLFGSYCDPIITKPGTYTRTCDVPPLQRLMIGYGWLATTADELEQEWQALEWQLYLDGQPVDLAAFGTLPDTRFFEAALGAEVWLRPWAVTLVSLAPGRHMLRYVIKKLRTFEDDPAGTFDATWAFTILEPASNPTEMTDPVSSAPSRSTIATTRVPFEAPATVRVCEVHLKEGQTWTHEPEASRELSTY